MKKLHFIIGLLCLLLVGYDSAFAQEPKPLFPQTPGMAAYTYRFSFPKGVEATLDTIRELGITEIEVGVNTYDLEPEAFRRMLDTRGMTAPSVGVGYEQLMEDPQEIARKAKVLGAKYVQVAWIPHEKDNFKLEDAQKAVADFNRVGKVLQENGLTFNYHTHGYEMKPYQNGTLFDYIAENTNPKYVSFTMDMLWTYHGGQNPANLLLKYPDRWTTMHLKDLKKGVKGDFTGLTPVENDVALGEGQLDIPAILKAAKKVGIKHYFIEDESPRVNTQVPRTMAYLKSLKE
ncbi:sugar phosphate isomerase/epimerase [Pontibacter diazotrophicus]|uniref:Sugar phosphate isomerase/epimerase n=1 Tax=Pontibacter diazotrophicus TaxID=1400979 RepID=A0A3D8LHQ8_9BACT|nr:sugar phosphate isomerase/epimerase [Pontibacter diazotrophicus]RDV16973.1 sugar phosphate isomerase/epimerase [Pontibacter diazotrophicus]